MADTYNLAELSDSNKGDDPPIQNLYAAAQYIRSLFEIHDIDYAFLGGFSMICRGHVRPTKDIDIAVQSKMKQLWQIVEQEKRFR
jgi:hypothetical protein